MEAEDDKASGRHAGVYLNKNGNSRRYLPPV